MSDFRSRNWNKRSKMSWKTLIPPVSSSKKFQRTTTDESTDGPAHMSRLSHEILVMIFDLVGHTSPDTLQSLASVSRRFYDAANYSRNKHVTLTLKPPDLESALKRLRRIEECGLLPAIVYLEVNGSCRKTPDDQELEFLQYLCTLLPGMTGLMEVRWTYSTERRDIVPEIVLETLHAKPTVRLSTIACSFSNRFQASSLGKLESNKNLSKLEVDCRYYGVGDCLNITQPLRRILISSPNIRSLSLNIRQPRSGCCIPPIIDKYCGLGLMMDDKLPILEELEMISYPWGNKISQHSSETNSHCWIGTDEVGLNEESEMDYWASTFDWSRLRRLRTSETSFALSAMPKLTALKEVEFLNTSRRDGPSTFCQECPAELEAISACALEIVTLDGILKHGGSLRKLELHNRENSRWAECAMDINSLQTIRDGCPLLEELYIDVARKNHWPWKMLDVLSGFQCLKSLTICFELGDPSKDGPIEPYVTFHAVDKIFAYLKSHAPKQPSKLERLHVYSGAPALLGYGLLAEEAYWPSYNSTDFICTLSERDDERAKGMYRIVCSKLPGLVEEGGKGADYKMNKANKKSSNRIEISHLRLAYKGPQSLLEYEKDL